MTVIVGCCLAHVSRARKKPTHGDADVLTCWNSREPSSPPVSRSHSACSRRTWTLRRDVAELVDPHRSGLRPAGHPMCAVQVRGLDERVEPVGSVVGDPHGIVLVADLMTDTTGPNVSVCASADALSTPPNTVGSMVAVGKGRRRSVAAQQRLARTCGHRGFDGGQDPGRLQTG